MSLSFIIYIYCNIFIYCIFKYSGILQYGYGSILLLTLLHFQHELKKKKKEKEKEEAIKMVIKIYVNVFGIYKSYILVWNIKNINEK